MNINKVIIIILLISSHSFAQTNEKKSKNRIDNINLKSYIDGLSEEYSVEKMDSDSKGITDMYAVFKKNDGNRSLITQVFDFNKDGKLDQANHFVKGKKIKSEFDLDLDGKIDSVSEFSAETGELLKKTLIENNGLIWKYWHKSELRRKEVDRNGDGEPDMWVHYRNGRVVKTEIDVGFDGKQIRVEGDLTKNK